jgi:hypothetical protein
MSTTFPAYSASSKVEVGEHHFPMRLILGDGVAQNYMGK